MIFTLISTLKISSDEFMVDYLGAEICQIATKVLDFKKYFLGLSFSLFYS